MTRFKGHAQDPENAINASYFVDVEGHKALTIMSFKRQPDFLPPIPVPAVTAFMVDNKAYLKANRGKLIGADISLECEEAEDGDNYCRTLDKRFNKVIYLKPKILNPRNIRHFLPNGEIISDPVFQDFLPDREIKISINLIEIVDNYDIGLNILPPAITQTPPDDFQGNIPHPPAPFTIYQDPPPMETETPASSAPASPASTMSISASDASSLYEAGNIQTSQGTAMILRPRDRQPGPDFEPMSTSTKSPEKKGTPYDDPIPGTSARDDQLSVTHPQQKKPKTPKKSPRKDLKRTASQPAIDDFLRARPQPPRLPSPIPRDVTRSAKRRRSPTSPEERESQRFRRILSDLSTEEREVTRNLEDALMRDDPAITEATVNPDSALSATGAGENPDNLIQQEPVLPTREADSLVRRLSSRRLSGATEKSSSSEGSTIPSKSDLELDDTPQDNVDHVTPFNPAEVSEDARNSNENPPPPETLENAGQSNDKSPSQSHNVLNNWEDARNSLRDLPLPNVEPSSKEHSGSSSDDIPPPSQGTSNELGKFDDDDQDPPSQSQSPPIVIEVGNGASLANQLIAFNIMNARIANANLDNAARPRRGPPTPEHVLIEINLDGEISNLLHFNAPHDPEDILEAFWNNTINSEAPDEGFDSTTDTTPSAPPPSSNEATLGSSPPPVITLSDNSIEILNDSSISNMSTNTTQQRDSQNRTIDISDSIEEEGEHSQERTEEEEERGE